MTWLLPLAVVCVFAAGVVSKVGDTHGQGRAGAAPQAPSAPMPSAPAPVLTPEEGLKSLTIAPGYKVEIAAAEPLIHAPVAIQFGPDGRLWVVEMNGYSPVLGGLGEDDPNGRVVALRDRDADGRYDEATVFLDNLVLPRSILLVGDGVLVGAPPELAFWRDTNGDGKADTKLVVASDYGAKPNPKLPLSTNAELFANGGLWAYDNWIYSAAYMKKFRYRDGAFETVPTIFRGQWGFTQDDYGRFYYNDNTHSLFGDVIFGDYLQRNPNYPRLEGTKVNIAADELVWPARETPGVNSGAQPARELRDGKLFKFTAACGPWIYRGDLLPALYGDAFVAEPVGNLVQRKVLTAEHGTVIGRNPYDRADFIASTDERFRPVNFGTGPDGALYVVDMYRGIVEHHSLISPYLREQIKAHQLEGPYRPRPHLPCRADRHAGATGRAHRAAHERAVGGAPRRRERVVARDRTASARRAVRRGGRAGGPANRDLQSAASWPGAGDVDARRPRRARSRDGDRRIRRQGTSRACRRAAPQRAAVRGRGRSPGSSRARPGIDEGPLT